VGLGGGVNFKSRW